MGKPARLDLETTQGTHDTLDLYVSKKVNGVKQPVDLSGYLEASFKARMHFGAGNPPAVDLSVANGGVDLTGSPNEGLVRLLFTPSATSSISITEHQDSIRLVCDLDLVDPSSNIRTVGRGVLTINKAV